MLPATCSRCRVRHTLRAPYRPRPISGRAVDPAQCSTSTTVSRDRPRRRRAGLGGVVGARGDLHLVLGQHAADRLDPEPVTVVVDERHYHGSRGSSSRAKNEDAANRISLARFSSRTSRSSSLIRLASDVVVPGRRPGVDLGLLHQPRSVSGTTPTRGPIRITAAFNDSSGSSASASAPAGSPAPATPADTSSVLA